MLAPVPDFADDEDALAEDGIDWDDEEAAEAEIDRVEAAMAAARPADAPQLTGVGPDGEDRDPCGEIADAQWQAFVRGAPRWWLVVPPIPPKGSGAWHYTQDAPGGAGAAKRTSRSRKAKGKALAGSEAASDTGPALPRVVSW